jgi:caa3-type cytochrome oxidase assembly factor Caa3/CtaG
MGDASGLVAPNVSRASQQSGNSRARADRPPRTKRGFRRLTLAAWHVPALLTMTLESEVWHSVEQSSFLGDGVLFWWPVVQPWPTVSIGPRWWTLLYLFFATLPCDVLAGFLMFSDRVAYPVYFSMPRHSGLSVMEDQQFAGALMWTCVTWSISCLPRSSAHACSRRGPREVATGVCGDALPFA